MPSLSSPPACSGWSMCRAPQPKPALPPQQRGFPSLSDDPQLTCLSTGRAGWEKKRRLRSPTPSRPPPALTCEDHDPPLLRCPRLGEGGRRRQLQAKSGLRPPPQDRWLAGWLAPRGSASTHLSLPRNSRLRLSRRCEPFRRQAGKGGAGPAKPSPHLLRSRFLPVKEAAQPPGPPPRGSAEEIREERRRAPGARQSSLRAALPAERTPARPAPSGLALCTSERISPDPETRLLSNAGSPRLTTAH